MASSMRGSTRRSPSLGRRSRAPERGAAAVEFALVIPLLITLVFGIIAFGVVFAQQLALSNAAREAARLGSVNLYDGGAGSPHDCQAVVETAREAIDALAVDPVNVSVDIARDGVTVCRADVGSTTASNPAATPCTGGLVTSQLQVSLEYRSELLVPVPVPGVGDAVELGAKGAFRCEYS